MYVCLIHYHSNTTPDGLFDSMKPRLLDKKYNMYIRQLLFMFESSK